MILREMSDRLAADLVARGLLAVSVTWWISFDPVSLEDNPIQDGGITFDDAGRLHPAHAGGTVRFPVRTDSAREIRSAVAEAFRSGVDPSLSVRRIGLSANDVRAEACAAQLDLFTDYAARDRERELQRAMLALRKKYGNNVLFKGMNLLEGATAMERGRQIGGHRA